MKLPRRPVHGVLLLDKPLGWTSNDAVQKVRGLFRALKAGHTGTLDPLATGLLPLCLGAATKFSQASLDADKRYTATLVLGTTTTTGDAEGPVLQTRPVRCRLSEVQAACERFRGEIEQTPPMHSALKHQGRALYDYARQGIEVPREPRRVMIHTLQVLSLEGETLVLDVHCSKGTYIRTLAQDLGETLGCGAHLGALRRTASGALRLEQAHTLEALQALDEAQRLQCLLPPQALLADWPEVRLPADEAGRFLSGLRRRVTLADRPAVTVFGPGPSAFLGIAHIRGGELIPDRLLSPTEVQDTP